MISFDSIPPRQQEKIFMGLLIGYCVLAAFSILLVFVESAIIDDLILNGRWVPSNSMVNSPFLGFLMVAFVVGFFGALVTSIVGLFKYRSWGRALFLILTIAGFILEFAFLGTDVSPSLGFASAFDSLGQMVAGMIIALSFLSPVALNFEPEDQPSHFPLAGQQEDTQAPAPQNKPPTLPASPVPPPTGETIELQVPNPDVDPPYQPPSSS